MECSSIQRSTRISAMFHIICKRFDSLCPLLLEKTPAAPSREQSEPRGGGREGGSRARSLLRLNHEKESVRGPGFSGFWFARLHAERGSGRLARPVSRHRQRTGQLPQPGDRQAGNGHHFVPGLWHRICAARGFFRQGQRRSHCGLRCDARVHGIPLCGDCQRSNRDEKQAWPADFHRKTN
jgi:hypothetical protein